MPPRKPHLKSRNGCAQCKRRKIKCDERPPLCGQCHKHRISCSFSGTTSSSSPPSATYHQPPSLDLSFTAPLTSSTLLDLELLQNFTSKTYSTITSSPNLSASQLEFYRTTFVQIAFPFPYYLHAILAISAFHLVYQHQKRGITKGVERYLIAAHTHHNSALQHFRPALYNVTEENCSALFACSFLITLMSFAQPRSVSAESQPSDSPRRVSTLVIEWFSLLRGIQPSTLELEQKIQTGPLAPIFESRKNFGMGEVDGDVLKHLEELNLVLAQRSVPHVRRVCGAAMVMMKQSFAGLGEKRENGASLAWVTQIEDEFVALLEVNTQEALLVLAYYCVLLYELRTFWWAEGWAEYILDCVEGLLDEQWKPWLAWPREVVYGVTTGLEDTA